MHGVRGPILWRRNPRSRQKLSREKSGMTIERATLPDAEEILSLQKLAYRNEAEIYNDFSIPPLLQTLEEVRKDFENQVFLKTARDGKIVGSVRAFLREETCYIGRLIVHPDFQNQGIGKELMNGIEETFKEARRFELFTGHRSEKNLHLYEKLGYRVFKTVKANERLTIVFLEKIKLSKEDRSRGH
jgi:ribosomal protein S18 acetylase RimI-like enzyme